MEVVAATDPRYQGQDLGELIGRKIGIKVAAEPLLKESKPDVLVLATSSLLKDMKPMLETAIASSVNVVSPGEELFYPQFVNKQLAEHIDQLAKRYGVRVLGRGVNPGCLMDSYPVQVFNQCKTARNFGDFEYIKIFRWDDTLERRSPLLIKTGAGLTEEDFYKGIGEGRIGHVGLRMSAAYLADHLGLVGYHIKFERKPIIAKERLKPLHGAEISAGDVAGLHEVCSVSLDGKTKIYLDLRMYVGATKNNSIIIGPIKDGKRTLDISFDYSNIVNGDIATHRILHQAIQHLVTGPSGLNSID